MVRLAGFELDFDSDELRGRAQREARRGETLMKRDGCRALPRRQVPRHVPGLTPDSLAATCLTPLPMTRWHKPVRRGSLAGLVVMAACLSAPPRAAAQSCATVGGIYTCTIASGAYTSAISVNAQDSGGNALPTQVTMS